VLSITYRFTGLALAVAGFDEKNNSLEERQMSEIKEKVIVIMGASSGIGEATAVKLAEQGAKVVIAARREERIKALAEKIGENVLYQTADVTNREQVQQVIDLAMTSFGRIDVLFNNAGIMPQGNLAELNYDS